MTRTVEEVAEALFDLHGWNGPSDNAGGLRNTILAALREARDAALHEAAAHLDRIAPYAEDQQTTFNAQGCAREVRLLASSPPLAAPARDDRGAEPCACGRTAETGCAKARDRERAASSSGEATALRLLALYRAKRAVDGLNGRPWDAVTHLAAEEALAAAGEVADPLASWEARVALRDRIAALAAPSQETETREATAEWTCKHGRNDTTPCPACDGPATEPLAAPAAQRDPEEAPCPECGNEVRHPGTGLLVCECPAPAPSAAPDTGKEPTP
jgi:hypothetical protein